MEASSNAESKGSRTLYRILVAAGVEAERCRYENIVDRAKDMELAGSTGNGCEVPDLVLSLQPDAVLLDMKLFGMDGLGCLEHIQCLQPGWKPPVLFISDIADEGFTARVFETGAAFFVLKPCDPEQIEERLRQFCLNSKQAKGILDIREQGSLLARYTAGSGVINRGSVGRCLTVTSWMLRNIGFTVHSPGFLYILEAVQIYLESDSHWPSITKIVYPRIGKKFGICETRVERCIRNAIDNACLRGDVEKLEMFLGDLSDYQHSGKPGNFRFIAMLTERVRAMYAAV